MLTPDKCLLFISRELNTKWGISYCQVTSQNHPNTARGFNKWNEDRLVWPPAADQGAPGDSYGHPQKEGVLISVGRWTWAQQIMDNKFCHKFWLTCSLWRWWPMLALTDQSWRGWRASHTPRPTAAWHGTFGITLLWQTLVSSLTTGGMEGLGHLAKKCISSFTEEKHLENLMISLKAWPMYMMRFQIRITLLPTAPSMFQNQKLQTDEEIRQHLNFYLKKRA